MTCRTMKMPMMKEGKKLELGGQEYTVVSTWTRPYRDANDFVKDKVFAKCADREGGLYFAKLEPDGGCIANEGRILDALAGLRGVPKIKYYGGGILVTGFCTGKPLSDFDNPSYWRLFMAFVGAAMIIRRVHKRKVAHSDVRPWNILYDGRFLVHLIDYEYAYDVRISREELVKVNQHILPIYCGRTQDWLDLAGCAYWFTRRPDWRKSALEIWGKKHWVYEHIEKALARYTLWRRRFRDILLRRAR